jgi:hypothetical protein
VRAERAEDVKAAVEWHCGQYGADAAVLLTLTVRHHYGDDLRALRAGIADAFRRLTRGKPWKQFKARVGLVGDIRALEVTHGENGFHPHIHAILLVRHPEAIDANHVAWLGERWARVVVRALGEAAEPNGHGLDVAPLHHAEYITKLGLALEVTGGAKRGRAGHRTFWQVLEDIGAAGALAHDERSAEEIAENRAEDIYIARTFSEAMKGARMLTWSRGLRSAAGLDEERTDDDIVEDAEVGVPVVAFPTWETWRDVPGLPAAVLTAGERGGVEAVEALLVWRLGPAPIGGWSRPYVHGGAEAEAASFEAAHAAE